MDALSWGSVCYGIAFWIHYEIRYVPHSQLFLPGGHHDLILNYVRGCNFILNIEYCVKSVSQNLVDLP